MDNEERIFANQVIGDSNQILIVAALTEANDDLQEENARLRNVNRVMRAANSALRGKLNEMMTSMDDLGSHIMPMSAEDEAGITK